MSYKVIPLSVFRVAHITNMSSEDLGKNINEWIHAIRKEYAIKNNIVHIMDIKYAATSIGSGNKPIFGALIVYRIT